MLWPNELAQVVIIALGLTSQEAQGIAVLSVLFLYLVSIIVFCVAAGAVLARVLGVKL